MRMFSGCPRFHASRRMCKSPCHVSTAKTAPPGPPFCTSGAQVCVALAPWNEPTSTTNRAGASNLLSTRDRIW